MMRQAFAVQGMSCGGCVNSVTRILNSLPGVKESKVSLEPGRAEVEFDPALASPEAIIRAIGNAGYEARAE